MPEFEDNKPQPDLNKDAHQYQPSQGKSDQKSSQAGSQSGQSSNMRGRWKRSARGPKPPLAEKEQPQQEPLYSMNEEEPSMEEDEEEFVHEREEIVIPREPRTPRSQPHKKAHEAPSKPVSRKDVFIPKTKQESERHKTRYPAMGRKKPSLWQRILAFFGLGSKSKRTTRKHKEDYSHDKSSRPHSGSYQKKRYSQPRKHTGQRSSAHKHPGKQGPKSGF